jgi:hypothetical protein
VQRSDEVAIGCVTAIGRDDKYAARISVAFR